MEQLHDESTAGRDAEGVKKVLLSKDGKGPGQGLDDGKRVVNECRSW